MTNTRSALQQLVFRTNADSNLTDSASSDDANAFQRGLQKSYSKIRKQFQKNVDGVDLTAAWSADFPWPDKADQHLAQLFAVRSTVAQTAIERSFESIVAFVVECVANDEDDVSPFVAITAAEILLRHVESISASETTALFTGCARLAASAYELPIESETSGSTLIFRLIASCEVPFVVSLAVESLKHTKKLRDVGRANISTLILDSSDTDGSAHACLVSMANNWLAPMARIGSWAASIESAWCSRKAESRWQNQVQRFVMLATRDGFISADRIPFGGPVPGNLGLAPLWVAAKQTNIQLPSAVSSLMKEISRGKAPERKKSRKVDEKQGANLVATCEQSDWCRSATMRTDLQTGADVVSTTWDQNAVRLGISSLGYRIMGGEWSREIIVDGQPVTNSGDWHCTCWFADEEVAFLELESVSEEVRHVRQVLLSLTDEFAVLVDSLSCQSKDSRIGFKSKLPLHGVATMANTITRELRLKSKELDVRVLPTWLDDDRIIHADGDCREIGGDLQNSASGIGGVTLPLLLDWNPQRVQSDADWSRLTITEDRQVNTGWSAAAYRARIGRLQLLFYRSLRPGESLRSVLGLNTKDETVIGHFSHKGIVTPLVSVDAEV